MSTMEKECYGMATGEKSMIEGASKFYKALVRAGRVKRWHTVDTVATQNVADHTYGVMCTLMLITDGNASRELLIAALSHDILEGITGDTPHPFKSQYPDEFNFLEDAAEAQIPKGFAPTITKDESNLLKVADLLECGVWATHELILGNAGALPIMLNVLRSISGMEVPPRAMAIIEALERNVSKYTENEDET